MNSYREVYKKLMDEILIHRNRNLEMEDIIFLFSSSKAKIERIINKKNKNDAKQDLINDNKKLKIFGYNLYEDFYKLISNASFLYQIQKLYEEYKSLDKSLEDISKSVKEKDNIKKMYGIKINPFREVFAQFINSIDKIYDNTEKNEKIIPIKNQTEFRKYVLNGLYKNDNSDILISKMILSLYLEACIHQYHNLLEHVKNAYELSITFGDITDLLKLKDKLRSWIQYRVIILKQVSKQIIQKQAYMYKSDMTITHNLTEFDCLDLSYYYEKIEIEKIKCLCRCRTEYFYKNKDTMLKEIDDFFNGNKTLNIKLLNDIPITNRDTIEYTIFQAIHAYDQIINELVHTRYKYLVNMREMLSNQDINYEKIPNIIQTLQQYLNYPLTFQHKTNNIDKLHLLLSENTNKVLLMKYLKLLSLYKYLDKNGFDIANKPSNPKTNIYEKISSHEYNDFKWDKMDNPINIEQMQYILMKINETRNEMSSYLPDDLMNLSIRIKHYLKEILKNIFNDPMNTLTNEYQIKMDKNKIDMKYSDFSIHLNGINTINEINLNDGLSYGFNKLFIDNINDDQQDINDKIKNYNEKKNFIVILRDSIKNNIDKIFINIDLLQNAYIEMKKLIDKTNTNDWTTGNTYKDDSNTNINDENKIDYNLIKAKDGTSNIHKRLSQLNSKLKNIYGEIKNSYDEIKTWLVQINGLILSLPGQLNDINSSSISLKHKIDNLVNQKTAEKGTTDIKINSLTIKITNLTTKITEKQKKLAKEKRTNHIFKKRVDDLNSEISTLTIYKANAENEKMNETKKETQLTKEINYLTNIDLSNTLKNCLNYYTTNQTNVTNLLTKYQQLEDTIKNTSLFDTGCTQLISSINNVFRNMQLFIASFIKKDSIDFKIDDHKDFELHRIKVGMYGLLDLAMQNFDGKRNNSYNNTYLGYFHSHKSFAFANGIAQLFKNFRNQPHNYDGIKIDLNIDLKTPGLDKTLINDIIPINRYKVVFENEYELFSIKNSFIDKYYNFVTPTEYCFGVYQIIDYLNKDLVFNIGDKLYDYFVSLNEIEKLPSIEFIVDYLKSKQYLKSDGNNFPNTINYQLYGQQYENLKVDINPDFKKILDDIYTLNIVELDPDIKINKFHSNNHIFFNIHKIFELIDRFSEYEFITFFFKTVRNTNVMINPNISSFIHTHIPYDDLYYYRQHIDMIYEPTRDHIHEPYYCSYFSLGSMCGFGETHPRINEFSNKGNELMVNIIEFTNGKL